MASELLVETFEETQSALRASNIRFALKAKYFSDIWFENDKKSKIDRKFISTNLEEMQKIHDTFVNHFWHKLQPIRRYITTGLYDEANQDITEIEKEGFSCVDTTEKQLLAKAQKIKDYLIEKKIWDLVKLENNFTSEISMIPFNLWSFQIFPNICYMTYFLRKEIKKKRR